MNQIRHFLLFALLVLNSPMQAEESNTINTATSESEKAVTITSEVATTEDQPTATTSATTTEEDETPTKPASPKGIYKLFHILGNLTDPLLTRGNLSEKHQKMFNEVARKLGIEDRGIQPKNVGLLARLYFGYANGFAVAFTNRAYFNDDALAQLSDEQKQFFMAHELTHLRNHHAFKFIPIHFITFKFLKHIIQSVNGENDPNNSFVGKYFQEGNKLFGLVPFSIFSLAEGQITQRFETEADTEAVTIAGLDPEDGVNWLEAAFENPDTTNWPLYAKIQLAIINCIKIIYNLPMINLHISHPPTYKRQEHLRSLKKLKTETEVIA